jgi:hypothetical protein
MEVHTYCEASTDEDEDEDGKNDQLHFQSDPFAARHRYAYCEMGP